MASPAETAAKIFAEMGAQEVEKLRQENERLLVALSNIATMSPHYVNGKFEDHAAFSSRIKMTALHSINPPK